MSLIRGALRRWKIVKNYNYMGFGWLSWVGMGRLGIRRKVFML